ncbi:MAG: ComF family protein [Gammaproteobacteria bacterium]|nr:ComF family protein [Gammaproteobacteria bacterium]
MNNKTGKTCPTASPLAPVPLSRKRLQDRSFNQAIEIARPVSNTLGIPLAYTLFERIRHSPAQSSLSLNARQKNVRGAFRIKYKKLPEHVAILDDVVTTGSTCNELARILKKQGVKKVEIWSIARAIRD